MWAYAGRKKKGNSYGMQTVISLSFSLVLYAIICNIRRLWLSVNTSVLVIFLNILKREVWLPEAGGEGNDVHFLTFPDATFSGSEIEAE